MEAAVPGTRAWDSVEERREMRGATEGPHFRDSGATSGRNMPPPGPGQPPLRSTPGRCRAGKRQPSKHPQPCRRRRRRCCSSGLRVFPENKAGGRAAEGGGGPGLREFSAAAPAAAGPATGRGQHGGAGIPHPGRGRTRGGGEQRRICKGDAGCRCVCVWGVQRGPQNS